MENGTSDFGIIIDAYKSDNMDFKCLSLKRNSSSDF